MISLLTRIFVKDYEDTRNPRVRRDYGIMTAIVGIVLNTFVFSIKAVAGMMTGSVAIIADGFNNLSDAGSSFLSMMGYRLSGREPDAEHPFGHGRVEYIMGLVVSIMIIVVGFELLTTSAGKIISPEEVRPTILSGLILVVSIFIKFQIQKCFINIFIISLLFVKISNNSLCSGNPYPEKSIHQQWRQQRQIPCQM